jgi:hypothetical protein
VKIPGRKLVGKAEEIGNLVGVPMTRGLGLSDLLKRTYKEAWKDHLEEGHILEGKNEGEKTIDADQ